MKRGSTLAILILLLVPACGGEGSSGNEVAMVKGQQFDPLAITVKAGEAITFTSDSPESHTVTAYEDSVPGTAEYFSSGGAPSEAEARDDVAAALIDEGGTYELTLDTPGTYRYFCIPHESQGMKGTITVTE